MAKTRPTARLPRPDLADGTHGTPKVLFHFATAAAVSLVNRHGGKASGTGGFQWHRAPDVPSAVNGCVYFAGLLTSTLGPSRQAVLNFENETNFAVFLDRCVLSLKKA